MSKSIAEWCQEITAWRAAKGFVTGRENIGDKLMLVVTELAEGFEGVREGKWSLADGKGSLEEELADTVIRVFDICGALRIDLEAAIVAKMEINAGRPFRHGKAL